MNAMKALHNMPNTATTVEIIDFLYFIGKHVEAEYQNNVKKFDYFKIPGLDEMSDHVDILADGLCYLAVMARPGDMDFLYRIFREQPETFVKYYMPFYFRHVGTFCNDDYEDSWNNALDYLAFVQRTNKDYMEFCRTNKED